MTEHQYVVLGSHDVEILTNMIKSTTETGEYELVSMVTLQSDYKDWMAGKPKMLVVFRKVNPLLGAAQRLAEAYGDYFNEGTTDQHKALEDAWRTFEELRRE